MTQQNEPVTPLALKPCPLMHNVYAGLRVSRTDPKIVCLDCGLTLAATDWPTLYERWHSRTRASSDTEQRLREALEPQPRLLTIEALEAVTNYFWGDDSPALSESEVQQLVESALTGIKAKALDEGTLERAARWIMDSLTGETNERVIEFAKNMAMTLRAALQPKAE